MLEYFRLERTYLYVKFNRNGFSGAYKKDPFHVSTLSLHPNGRAVTGVSTLREITSLAVPAKLIICFSRFSIT